MASRGKPARSALHGNPFPIAIHVRSRNRRMFEGETNVVRDKQVQVSVSVVIEKAASSAPAHLVVQETSSFRHIRKSAVTIVAVKNVLPEVSAENIFKTVAIVVPDAHAASPASRMQPRLFRNVGERPVAIVLIQTIRCAIRHALNPRAAEHKNIHTA